jgi:hypothetical protein
LYWIAPGIFYVVAWGHVSTAAGVIALASAAGLILFLLLLLVLLVLLVLSIRR